MDLAKTIDETKIIEHRSALNFRAAVDKKGVIIGCPIVFNQRTAIGNYFYEEVDPHALDNADLSDIKLLINHDDSMIPIARHRRGKRSTMDVSIDDEGMKIEARLDLELNGAARALYSAVAREDISDMSFCFRMEVEGDEWSDIQAPMPIRRITKISKVYEISAVNDGAYPQTSINARSAASLDNAKKTLDNVRAAALDNEKRAKNEILDFEKQKFLFMEELKHYES